MLGSWVIVIKILCFNCLFCFLKFIVQKFMIMLIKSVKEVFDMEVESFSVSFGRGERECDKGRNEL